MRFASHRLAEARLTLNLTQEELARSVGIDVRTYRRYESGAVNDGGFDLGRAERSRIVDRLGAELGLDRAELVVEDPTRGPHALPPTRDFVGRAELLADLRAWRQRPDPVRIVALVAVGGAGKTAVARHLCDGAFGWSFYQEPTVEALVDALLVRVDQPLDPPGTRMDRLESALRRCGPLLLVLDGLEELQADGTGDRAEGEIEDPQLRRLLLALADGLGQVKVLVTSRRAPRDLDRSLGYRRVDLPPLSTEEGGALLASLGVADGPEVARWVGGHALSLGVAAAFLRRTGRGLPDLVELDLGRARREDPLARRLLAVLEAQVGGLEPAERDVFAALSIFPTGATLDALANLPLAVPGPDLVRIAARLAELELAQSDGRRWFLHPLVARYAGTLLERGGAALHEAERARLEESLGTRLDLADETVRDRVERLVHHAVRAGRSQDAEHLYRRVLGGFDNLGLRRGELARGARITRALAEAPMDRRSGSRIRYDRGLYEVALGDLAGARVSFGRVGADGRADGDPVLVTTALRALAYTARLQGDHDAAREALDGAIGLAEALGDRPHLVRALALRAAVLHDQGRWDEAGAGFAAVRALGDDPTERRGLWEAEHLVDRGELDLARDRTLRNLDRCAARDWPGHVAHCHAVLGTIAARAGGSEAGRAHLDQLRSWVDRTGEVEMALRAHLLALELGDREDGRVGAEKAHRLGYDPLAARLRRTS